MERPVRKPNRLRAYDYSQPGCYFVTICTKERRPLFWAEDVPDTSVGADIIRPRPILLSKLGLVVEHAILEMPRRYANVTLDQYVIMPNHVHILLTLGDQNGRMISAPTKGLPIVVGQMKRTVSKQAHMDIWQKGYHDHVIRNDADYLRIWDYMETNPAKWREDRYYCPEEGR